MRTFFTILLALHGLIHLIGFFRAFAFMEGKGFTIPITRPMGILWLTAFVLFAVVAGMYFYGYKEWWIFGSLAVIVSQFLIIRTWNDSKFGTIVNIVVLFVIIADFGTWHFRNSFLKEVNEGLKSSGKDSAVILTESDISALPIHVQQYIRYSGAIGKPRVENFRVEFTGQIRKNEQSPWMPLHSVQYNFMKVPTRLFFMDATMMHLPVSGFHCFKDGTANMDIRLLSLIPVQYQDGKEMGIAETVTFFNDMCVLAPATLIDPRIKWEGTDGNKVKASFTNNNITISAILTFNERGQLINFESDDRYAADDKEGMRRLPWYTPMKNYTNFHGVKLSSHGDAIYKYPEGDLTYGEFDLKEVEYNCTESEI